MKTKRTSALGTRGARVVARRSGLPRGSLESGQVSVGRARAVRLHDSVVREIAGAIMRKEHSPGDLLPTEPELCDQYGVSRTVVRDALRVLSTKGLVNVEHGRGTRVNDPEEWASLDPLLIQLRDESGTLAEVLNELIELRRIFEVESAALAAERGKPENLERMAHALELMVESRGEASLYAAADLQFHDALARAAHNSLLRRIQAPMTELMRVGFRVNASGRDLEKSLSQHRAVYSALVSRQPKEARAAMQAVIDEFERSLHRAFGTGTQRRGRSTESRARPRSLSQRA